MEIYSLSIAPENAAQALALDLLEQRLELAQVSAQEKADSLYAIDGIKEERRLQALDQGAE